MKQYKVILMETVKYYSRTYGLQGQRHRVTLIHKDNEREILIGEDGGYLGQRQALEEILSNNNLKELSDVIIITDPIRTNKKRNLKEYLSPCGVSTTI